MYLFQILLLHRDDQVQLIVLIRTVSTSFSAVVGSIIKHHHRRKFSKKKIPFLDVFDFFSLWNFSCQRSFFVLNPSMGAIIGTHNPRLVSEDRLGRILPAMTWKSLRFSSTVVMLNICSHTGLCILASHRGRYERNLSFHTCETRSMYQGNVGTLDVSNFSRSCYGVF